MTDRPLHYVHGKLDFQSFVREEVGVKYVLLSLRGGVIFVKSMSRGCSQYEILQLSFVVSESQNTESFASMVKFRGID